MAVSRPLTSNVKLDFNRKSSDHKDTPASLFVAYYTILLILYILSPVENHRKEANNYEGRITEKKDFRERQRSFYWSGRSQRELTCYSPGGWKRSFPWGVSQVNIMPSQGSWIILRIGGSRLQVLIL